MPSTASSTETASAGTPAAFISAKRFYQYAFLDSGTGGLPYLAQLKAHAPGASCVYVADTEHFPYGEKTREQVIAFAKNTVAHLLERFRPEVIVIACNTISVAALAELRSHFDVPFVGTVPAIKLASASSKNRRIGLLATARTVSDPYTDELIRQFASDCFIERIGDSTLISRIETDLITASDAERLAAVRPSIDRFKAAGVDTIVLACTHFLHVTDAIRQAAGPDIRIIDSREGVVQQALRLVHPDPGYTHSEGACFITGKLDSAQDERFSALAARFGIAWGGVL